MCLGFPGGYFRRGGRLFRQLRSCLLEYIRGLPVFRPCNISQRRDQNCPLCSIKDAFGPFCQLKPVMPIPNYVLHALKLLDSLLGLRIIARYFRQISCSLARAPVLVHSLLALRTLISPKLKHRTDGQVQELCGAVRHLDFHSTPFEPFAKLRNLLLVKRPLQPPLPRRPLVRQYTQQLRFPLSFLRQLQTSKRRNLHVQVTNPACLLTQASQQL